MKPEKKTVIVSMGDAQVAITGQFTHVVQNEKSSQVMGVVPGTELEYRWPVDIDDWRFQEFSVSPESMPKLGEE